MLKKKTIAISVGLFVLLFLMNSMTTSNVTAPVTRVSAAYKAATITVAAWDDELVANTPIIIDESEFSGDFSLATAIVRSGTTDLMTQYDEELGELVFQLPSKIAAGGSTSFDLYAKATGTTNDQTASISLGKGEYNATFDDWLPAYFKESLFDPSGDVVKASDSWWGPNSVGGVVWVETDWGILCLQVNTSWRQGSWKHVILKGENFDAVNAHYNATTEAWKWGVGALSDSDPAWLHGGAGPTVPGDKLTIYKVGPVRAVIQVVSSVGYKEYDEIQNTNKSSTFTIYDGFSGIAQHFELTGANATQAFTDFRVLNQDQPMLFETKVTDFGGRTVPGGGSNNYTWYYTPGHPVEYRYPIATFDLGLVLDSYIGVYNNDSYGFVFNWGPYELKENITKIDWGDADCILVWFSLDYFPAEGIRRYYLPFSGTDVGTGSVTDYVDALNAQWVAGYTTVVIEHEPATTGVETTGSETEASETSDGGAPGFGFLTTILVIAAVSVIYYRKRK